MVPDEAESRIFEGWGLLEGGFVEAALAADLIKT